MPTTRRLASCLGLSGLGLIYQRRDPSSATKRLVPIGPVTAGPFRHPERQPGVFVLGLGFRV